MKTILGLLAASAFVLSACSDGVTAPPATPTGDSAGAAGPAYCETVPANPEEMTTWNQLCSPGRG